MVYPRYSGRQRLTFPKLMIWIRISFISIFIFSILSFIFTLITIIFLIKLKFQNKTSFDESTLNIGKEDEKRIDNQIIVLDSILIKIQNLNKLSIFSSSWVSSALNQYKGLEKAILCDIYEAMYLPKEEVATNLGTIYHLI